MSGLYFKKDGNSKTVLLRSILCAMLCFVMLLSSLSGAISYTAGEDGASYLSSPYSITPGTTNHLADGNTMDTYLYSLNLADSSRYAGRIWSDKSVFTSQNGSLSLTLDMPTDGIDGTFTFDQLATEDFLHVFSTLGSSQIPNVVRDVPLDVTFILDMSGSMGEKVTDGPGTDGKGPTTRLDHAVEALNETFDLLMKQNEYNRTALYIYSADGDTRWVDQFYNIGYQQTERVAKKDPVTDEDLKDSNGESIRISKFMQLSGTQTDGADGFEILPLGRYDEKATAAQDSYFGGRNLSLTQLSNDTLTGNNREAVRGYGNGTSTFYDYREVANGVTGMGYGNGSTWMTVNIKDFAPDNQKVRYRAFGATNTQMGLYTGMSAMASERNSDIKVTIDGEEITRIPVVILITDGNPTYSSASQTWWEPGTTTLYGRSKAEDFQGPGNASFLGNGLLTMMTAAYWKQQINLHYYGEANPESSINSAKIFTVGVDFDKLTSSRTGDPYNPKQFATAVLNPSGLLENGTTDPAREIRNAWNTYNSGSNVTVSVDFTNTRRYTSTPTGYAVSMYNPETKARNELIDENNGWQLIPSKSQLYSSDGQPFSYDPSKTEGNFLTGYTYYYRVPAGQPYWDQAPNNNNAKYYYQYSVTHPTANDITDLKYNDEFHDTDSAHLADTLTGIIDKLYGSAFTPIEGTNDADVKDSLTYIDPIGKYMEVKSVKNLLLFGVMYGLTEDRLEYYSAADDTHPIKTVYPNSADKTAPTSYAYTKQWYKVECDNHQTVNPCYDTAEQVYNLNTGQYDTVVKHNVTFDPAKIEVYVKVTDDYRDTTISDGALQSDPGEDQALYITIPVEALPLRMVTINTIVELEKDENGVNGDVIKSYKYSTNLGEGKSPTVPDEKGKTRDDYYRESTPLRVFYTVGMDTEYLVDTNGDGVGDGKIDLTTISSAYLKDNRKNGKVYFYSNWYNKTNRYGGYVTGTEADGYTYGDPALTFSPSETNRYYIFQKALPLYSTGSTTMPARSEGEVEWREARTVGRVTYPAGWYFAGATDPIGTAVTSVPGNASNEYFYIVVDYFIPRNDGSGEADMVRYAVARKGSEFGSKIGSDETAAGSYLCWFNTVTEETKTFSNSNPGSGTGDSSNWVLATKIGGLRTGDMAQSVHVKGGTIENSGNLTFGANSTETAETYYLPTISSSSGADFETIVVNIYMGNNGYLSVDDTQLLVTKEVDDDKIRDEYFSYTVTLTNPIVSGTYHAIRVLQEEDNNADTWRAKIKTIELLTSNKGLLVGGTGDFAVTQNDRGKDCYIYVGGEGGAYSLFPSANVDSLTDHHELTVTAYLIPVDDYSNNWNFSGSGDKRENFKVATVDLTSPIGLEVDSDYNIRTTYDTVPVTFDSTGKSTSEIKLKHGEGLLFIGLDSGTHYTVMEKLSKDQLARGIMLKTLIHEYWKWKGPDNDGNWSLEHINDMIDGKFVGDSFFGRNPVVGDSGGYTPKFDPDEGEFPYEGETASGFVEHLHYNNTIYTTSLEISKTFVNLNGTYDPNDEYAFEVEIKYADTAKTPLTGTYHAYVHPTGEECMPEYDHPHTEAGVSERTGERDLTFTGGKTSLTLKAGETFVITELPPGASYTVRETPPASGTGYRYEKPDMSADSTYERVDDYTVSGTLNKLGDSEEIPKVSVSYTNKIIELRDLTVTKTVRGGDDTGKEFDFTVTLLTLPSGVTLGDEATYSYIKTGSGITDSETGTLTFKKQANGTYTATFKLKHGQSITIKDLPYGTTYKVEETSVPGYETKTSGDVNGTLNANKTADFENVPYGSLTVEKVVAGGTSNDGFEFVIQLTPPAGETELPDSYEYEGVFGKIADVTNAVEPSEARVTLHFVKKTEGDKVYYEATVFLKHGQYVTIDKIPAGTTYTVTEQNIPDGYMQDTDKTVGDSGTIEINSESKAHFVNIMLYELPHTGGGISATLWKIGAVLLMMTLSLLYVSTKSKRRHGKKPTAKYFSA